MSFWSFFGSNHDTNLVLTIASSQVTAAIYRRINQKLEILAVSASPIALGENLEFERFIAATGKAIEDALKRVRQVRPRPRKVHCLLASPWYVAQTRIINYQTEKSFVVNQEFINSLVSREAKIFENEQRRGRTVILGTENKIIEAQKMKTLLNGYQTDKPLDKKVNSFSLSVFFSLTSRKIVNSFASIIHKTFHHSGSDLIFHSLPFAVFSVINVYFPNERNFVLVEVGGEVTDLLFSHQGIIDEVASIPIGENFLYRSIASRFATKPREAESLVRAYLDGALSSQLSNNLAKAIDQVKGEWLEAFKKVIALSALEYLLPGKCFLLANPQALTFFKKFLSDSTLASATDSGKPLKVESLERGALKGLNLVIKGGPAGAFQLLPAIFAARLN